MRAYWLTFDSHMSFDKLWLSANQITRDLTINIMYLREAHFFSGNEIIKFPWCTSHYVHLKSPTQHCHQQRIKSASYTTDASTVLTFSHQPISPSVGDMVAQWLLQRNWDQKVERLRPGWCTHIAFSGKTLNSPSASLPPGV